MPTFEIESNGQSYEIEAPDQATALRTFETFRGQPSQQAQQPQDPWQRNMILPREQNTQTGENRLAVPQILQSMWDAVQLPGDAAAGRVPDLDPRMGVENMSDETFSRVNELGGLVTPGSPMGPNATISRTTGQPVPRRIVEAIGRDGITPGQVGPRVNAMGPGAITADLGNATQSLAMGVGARPSAGQTMFLDMLKARAETARPRIQAQVNDILGPSRSRGMQAVEIEAMREATSPLYKTSFSQAAPVNVAQIAGTIDQMLPNLAGEARSQLVRIRGWLSPNGQLTDNPELLFSVRNAIDDLLASPTVGRAATQIGEIRKLVDTELAARVPGIKDADARWVELSRQNKMFDEGTAVFDQGRTTVDPRDLANDLVAGAQPQGTMAGPSGAAFAFTQGTRNEIDRLIGTGTQNRTKLASTIRGDGTWNREKLILEFGQEKADALIRLFDNEAAMMATEYGVSGGSITALREAAKDANTPSQVQIPILEGPFGVNIGNAARRGINALTGGLAERASLRSNDEVIRGLMESGGMYRNTNNSPLTLNAIRGLLVGGNQNQQNGILNMPFDGINSSTRNLLSGVR